MKIHQISLALLYLKRKHSCGKTSLFVYLALFLVSCVVSLNLPDDSSMTEGLTALDAHIEQNKVNINWSLFRSFFLKHRSPPTDPKLRASWYAHTTRFQNKRSPIYLNRIEKDGRIISYKKVREIGIGNLGLPFETIAIIQGVREGRGKVGKKTLAVAKVNSKHLEIQVRMRIDNIQKPGLPEDKLCILKGYETGSWIGERWPNYQSTFPLCFYNKFIVTEVIEPSDVMLIR